MLLRILLTLPILHTLSTLPNIINEKPSKIDSRLIFTLLADTDAQVDTKPFFVALFSLVVQHKVNLKTESWLVEIW